jgi:PhnB protein
MPLTRTFWSPSFGMLEDRFGIGWMVSIPSHEAQSKRQGLLQDC